MLSRIRKSIKLFIVCAFVIAATVSVFAASGLTEASVIGQVESVFNNRIGLKILHVTQISESMDVIASGSWISFDLPGDFDKGRRNNKINFGSVIEVELIGNTATEYAITNDGDKKGVQQPNNVVLLWTAQTVKLVKNPNDYLPEEEKTGKKRRKNRKKTDEPLKIWTQQETIRGVVLVKNEKVYLKEEHLGRRDKGLEVTSAEWTEKLGVYSGNKVVLHGTTHRTSVSSGTIEIGNVMKIYSK